MLLLLPQQSMPQRQPLHSYKSFHLLLLLQNCQAHPLALLLLLAMAMLPLPLTANMQRRLQPLFVTYTKLTP
jgi:hypothetical protein